MVVLCDVLGLVSLDESLINVVELPEASRCYFAAVQLEDAGWDVLAVTNGTLIQLFLRRTYGWFRLLGATLDSKELFIIRCKPTLLCLCPSSLPIFSSQSRGLLRGNFDKYPEWF